MPSWFDKLRGKTGSSEITTYKAIRTASKTWVDKVMGHPASQSFDLLKAARKLTLPLEGKTIIFEGETEQALLFDFYLLEYRPEGKSVLESCTFSPGELTPDEASNHLAMLASRTSLFEALAVHERDPKILLRDLLKPDAPEFWLTDLGLSDSVRKIGKVLFFTRIISLQNLHMTGGFSFTFDSKLSALLVSGYQREIWSVPAARHKHWRIIHFLAQHRKHGLESEYQDISDTPPAS